MDECALFAGGLGLSLGLEGWGGRVFGGGWRW